MNKMRHTENKQEFLPGMVFYNPQSIGQPSWVIHSIENEKVELHQFSKINSTQVRTIAQLQQAIDEGKMAPVHKHNQMIKDRVIVWKNPNLQ